MEVVIAVELLPGRVSSYLKCLCHSVQLCTERRALSVSLLELQDVLTRIAKVQVDTDWLARVTVPKSEWLDGSQLLRMS